jgi:hypothetical protein
MKPEDIQRRQKRVTAILNRLNNMSSHAPEPSRSYDVSLKAMEVDALYMIGEQLSLLNVTLKQLASGTNTLDLSQERKVS